MENVKPLPAADAGQRPCEPPMPPLECLRDLRAWLRDKSEHAPRETKGYADNSGHPHFWSAILFPDWNVRQKLSEIEDTLRVAEPLTSAAPELLAALKSVWALIDSGQLRRNTSDDANPDFAMRQIPFVMALKEMDTAIAKAEGRT